MPTSSTEALPEVHYPESDGQPMGETGIHVNATVEILSTLKLFHFRDRHDLYITGDMFFYYEQGNPRAVKAPDVMIIKGVTSREERRTFKLWVEKRVPNVIFEITSEETRRDDTVIKRELYARLGVAEYFLFDPLGEYLDPPLQGFRLAEEEYIAILPDESGWFEIQELDLKIQADDDSVRFFDTTTNRPIPNSYERGDAAQAVELLRGSLLKGKKQLERERRKSAREAQKAETERQKAEAERQKAETERQKAETERQKAETLEAEVVRLRALLKDRDASG